MNRSDSDPRISHFSHSTSPTPGPDLFSRLLNLADEGLLLVNPDGTVLYANRAAQGLLGEGPEILEENEFLFPIYGPGLAMVDLPGKGQSNRMGEMRCYEAEWVNTRIWVVSLREVTETRRVQEAQQQSAKIFEHSREGIFVTGPDQRIVAVNPAVTQITGYSEAELVGNTPRMLQSEVQGEGFYRQLWDSLNQVGFWSGEIWNRRKNGEVHPEWKTISEVRNKEGELTHYVSVFSDITQLRSTEEEVHFLTCRDLLTGLWNRSHFRYQLQQALKHLSGSNRHLAVATFDLKGFRDLNDSLGHAVADGVLQRAAKRLQSALAQTETIARPGSDEFWILLEDLRGPYEAERWVRQLLNVLQEPMKLADQTLRLRAYVGVALAPDDTDDADILLNQAATALHRSQQKSQTNIEFFRPEFGEQAQQRLQLEEALQWALEQEQFELWYQPQIDLASGAVVGVEALARWPHPEWGMISPATFIPLAEEMELILRLGDSVLTQAINQATLWRQRGLAIGHIGVNVATVQLIGTDLPDQVRNKLAAQGMPAQDLQIEVTEHGIMADPEAARETLQALSSQGIGLALDDFGTGYSALAYLKNFDFDVLKVDKSFIDGLPQDTNDASIVQAIQAMAQSLNQVVIAEGVETVQQADWLIRNRIQQAQGFLYARPMPAEKLEQWLRNRNSR